MATKRKINKKSVKKVASSCKVCKHEHIVEIETALVVHNKPSREVEKMIKDNGWEPVSYVTLLTHLKEHVDTKRELVLKYLEEKKQILERELAPADDPEVDELSIRLSALKKLDSSIFEANALLVQSSKALQEQLALRVETPDKYGNKTKSSARGETDKKRAYVPIQRDLVALYKNASEELRMTIKQKLEALGVDSDSRNADSITSLVDLVIDQSVKDKDE